MRRLAGTQRYPLLLGLAGLALFLAAVGCSTGKVGSDGTATKKDTESILNIDAGVLGDGWEYPDGADAEAEVVDGPTSDVESGADLPGLDAVANCPGGSGCPCSDHLGCESGLCIDDPTLPEGKSCAQKCTTSCPGGYTCAAVTGGSDIHTICVPKFAHLCDPCAASKDCEVIGLKDSICVDQGGQGRYCGVACNIDGDCPQDYGCMLVASVEGAKIKQCVRKGATDGVVPGTCTCSTAAVMKQLATQCLGEVLGAGNLGKVGCKGVRTCTAAGLSPCNAPAPATETCDGADNDCDGETDEATCNDQLPCTKDICDGKGECLFMFTAGPGCDLAKGCTQVSDNGKPCEADNDLCTQGDTCASGTCKAGTPQQCDDGNPCTIDGCDKKTGQCTAAAVDDGVPCNDGTKCTEKDACQAGVCKGKGLVCDDDNPCTDDVCDPKLGCQISNLTGAACSDDDPCTVGDLCANGQCASGGPKACTSADPCVTAKCSPLDGKCKLGEAATGTPCDDGNLCTAGESCDQGVCQGGANSCACQNDKDCASQEDGNLCNGTLYCEKGLLPYACKVKAYSIVKCDTSGDGECTTTVCGPKSGVCEKVAVADGKACDADGSTCTEGDVCAAGGCLAGKAKNCDDGNACTDDACDPAIGCKKSSNSKPCDDGNTCSTGDSCTAGVCSGVPLNPATNCGDSNPCTNDACDPKLGCTHAPNQAQCDDGNPCTVADVCGLGACKSGGTNDCSDGNPCTIDSCSAEKGCQSAPVAEGAMCGPEKLCISGQCIISATGVDLVSGSSLICARTSTKELRCWNSFWPTPNLVLAQVEKAFDGLALLGSGAYAAFELTKLEATVSVTTKEIKGLTAPVKRAASVGGGTGCALQANGAVKCWGAGIFLGDGKTNNSPGLAVQVVGFENGARDVANAGTGFLGISADGGLYSWGTTAVPSLIGEMATAAKRVCSRGGDDFMCVITESGSVKCWHPSGQYPVGDGTSVSKVKPTQVVGLEGGVADISCGSKHVCVLMDDGGVKCWGNNSVGQCGDGGSSTSAYRYAPVDVVGLQGPAVALRLDYAKSCALLLSGAVQCWGQEPLGDGPEFYLSPSMPVKVPLSSPGDAIEDIRGGASLNCALWKSGKVSCWGGKVDDKLGFFKDAPVSVEIGGVGKAKALRLGADFACVVTQDDTVRCWGANQFGELGDGTTVSRLSPAPVSGLGAVKDLSCGTHGCCAVLGTNGVKCWGGYFLGGGIVKEPVDLSSALGSDVATTVSKSEQQVVALTAKGTLKSLGGNSPTALDPNKSSGFQSLSAEQTTFCGRKTDGSVWCFGNGALFPGGMGKVASIGTGASSAPSLGIGQACVVMTAGNVMCWGGNILNSDGKTTSTQATPVYLPGLKANVKVVAASGYSICVVLEVGEVWCMGPLGAALGNGGLFKPYPTFIQGFGK